MFFCYIFVYIFPFFLLCLNVIVDDQFCYLVVYYSMYETRDVNMETVLFIC